MINQLLTRIIVNKRQREKNQKGISNMDTPESQTTLNTRHRTTANTTQKTKKHLRVSGMYNAH